MGLIDVNKLEQGETKVIKASVTVVGVKVRCRKVERHSLSLGDYELDTTEAELIERAKSVVNANMRSIQGEPVLELVSNVFELNGHMLVRRFSSDDIFNRKQIKLGA